jgi:hypothetical protein
MNYIRVAQETPGIPYTEAFAGGGGGHMIGKNATHSGCNEVTWTSTPLYRGLHIFVYNEIRGTTINPDGGDLTTLSTKKQQV